MRSTETPTNHSSERGASSFAECGAVAREIGLGKEANVSSAGMDVRRMVLDRPEAVKRVLEWMQAHKRAGRKRQSTKCTPHTALFTMVWPVNCESNGDIVSLKARNRRIAR
jgi:hypothetical protein